MTRISAEQAKARSLRRYEASAVPWASDRAEPRLDFYSPFGPMIAKTTMAPTLIARLNRYADRMVTPSAACEFTVPPEVVEDGGAQSLLQVTEAAITRYVTGVHGVPPENVRVETFWIVSQVAGTASPMHHHSSDISGVLYLKVPEIADPAEEEKTYISNRRAGYINFMIGGRQDFSRSLISFKPEVGAFYVFPGWLLHGVEPFDGSGERRSLAFNAYVQTQ